MTALVVYDSRYGNTAEIAKNIASAIPGGADVRLLADVDAATLPKVDLLVVGSPTHGGRPTPAMQAWLTRVPAAALANVRCAAFDTRLPTLDQNLALRWLMRVIGFAAPRIAKTLVLRRGVLATAPAGFLVDGSEGPLREGERERAATWARALASDR